MGTGKIGIHLGEIAQIVLPVFVLAALGYITARTGYLSREAGDGLAAFVFNVAIPILLFRSIAFAEFPDISPWTIWLTYLPAIVVAWIAAAVLIIIIARRGYRASVIGGVAAGFSNLVLVGIPLMERAYGQAGLTIHFLLLAVHLPFMMALSTFLMEFAVRADGVEKAPISIKAVSTQLLTNFIKNPIIIGILLGGFWRLAQLETPDSVVSILDLLGKTAGPLALFALGMSFLKYSIRGNWQPAVGLALVSVLAMPAIALFFGTQVFVLPPLWLKVVVLAAACPTGVNAYLFASYFKIAEGLASSSIIFAALFSIPALPFWLMVLSAY